MTELTEKKCIPCEGAVRPLDKAAIKDFISKVPLWQVADDYKSIHRNFQFKNFYHTMAFVNAIAWIANRENHHPDLEVGYNKCKVRYSTHAINGLSENDFICAAKVDSLL